VSQRVSVLHIRRAVCMAQWRETVTAELNSNEWVDKWICGVLCSRPVSLLWASVYKRTKQTVDTAISPEYWVHKCRVISCEWFLTFLWVFCFNYRLFNSINCNDNKRSYQWNPQAYLLQYERIKNLMWPRDYSEILWMKIHFFPQTTRPMQ